MMSDNGEVSSKKRKNDEINENNDENNDHSEKNNQNGNESDKKSAPEPEHCHDSAPEAVLGSVSHKIKETDVALETNEIEEKEDDEYVICPGFGRMKMPKEVKRVNSWELSNMTEIIEIKITLAGSYPAIWRRIQVPGNTNLVDLHEILQTAMGWDNCHAHKFDINGNGYSEEMGMGHGNRDESKVTLSEAATYIHRIL
jgi:hypothetical protein